MCVSERYKNTDRPKMWFNGFNMAAGLIRGPTMQRERERERVCCVCERYKNKDCPKFCLMDFQMAACLIRGPTMQRESECVVCV